MLTMTADIKGISDGFDANIEVFEHDSDSAHDKITGFPVSVKGSKIETEWEYEYHEDTDDIPVDGESESGYSHPEYFFRVTVQGITAD